jgi:pimeloyl-ACP methyl ester carboxylesterase
VRRSRGQIVAGLAGIMAMVLLALWFGASYVAERVTLHPRHWGIGPTPAQLGYAYQDVSFRDHAGLTLRGWWIPGTKHETVVMVHGWTSSRAEPMSKAGYLIDAGYNVLVFDLRGHGQSDGDYTTLGLTEPDDVASAVAFARSRGPGPIALLGYSMGGALAVETGARDADVAAVIEDSGYGSLASVFQAGFQRQSHLPAVPFGLPLVAIGQVDLHMQLSAVRPVLDAARLHKPLLAIVGTADQVVPPSEGFDIFRAAPGPKQLLVVPGAGHVDGYRVDRARYVRTVLSFLASTIGR